LLLLPASGRNGCEIDLPNLLPKEGSTNPSIGRRQDESTNSIPWGVLCVINRRHVYRAEFVLYNDLVS